MSSCKVAFGLVVLLGTVHCADGPAPPPRPSAAGAMAAAAGVSGSDSRPVGGGGAAASEGGASGSTAAAAQPGLSSAGSVPGGASDGGGSAGAQGCPSEVFTPGDHAGTLEHDGVLRSFIVHVPAGDDTSQPLPLVLNFHGATSTSEAQQSLSRMDVKADAEGFIVVYPEGSSLHWNAGDCCGDAATNGVDDVGFARALVAHVSEHACVDAQRVFATGFSNGGRMSYRLGCEAADLFAAIAPVAGVKSYPDQANSPGCTPSRPVPLLDIMGTADERIVAQPGQIAEWAALDGCGGAPQESYRQGAHFCKTYAQCATATAASVTYCQVEGVDHTWPNVEGFSTNDRIWELFARSSL
jgi:polyhydroxybutyrate depolymerase